MVTRENMAEWLDRCACLLRNTGPTSLQRAKADRTCNQLGWAGIPNSSVARMAVLTWKRPWWWTTPSWLCRRERSEYSVWSSILPWRSSWVSVPLSFLSSKVRIFGESRQRKKNAHTHIAFLSRKSTSSNIKLCAWNIYSWNKETLVPDLWGLGQSCSTLAALCAVVSAV